MTDISEVNDVKLVNPIPIGTLYFGFALTLWSIDQLTNPVISIAIFTSVVSIAFFIGVFCKWWLKLISSWITRFLVLVSLFIYVYGFTIGWIQSFGQTADIPQTFIIYFGFLWIVTMLLVQIRDATKPRINNKKHILIFRRIAPIIVLLVLCVFSLIRFINQDYWGGGYAIGIAILSILVITGKLPVYGEIQED